MDEISRKFGLIGFPLSHSFSKQYFTEKYLKEGIKDAQYELYPLENIQQLKALLEAEPLLQGLNVTIPYKVAVLDFLQELDEPASVMAAVNCIGIERKDNAYILKGYNTDAHGFEASLKPLLQAQHTKALIFGNGGAAQAVKYVLKRLHIEYISVTRTASAESILYDAVDAQMLKTHTLLINTTPLGMAPNILSCPPIDYSQLSNQHLAYDLVYNPLETRFLALAQAAGASVKNGLEMLHLQAEKAWSIWNK